MESDYVARRVVKSDPDYKELNKLQMMLCHAYNPHLITHNDDFMDMDPVMIPSLIQTLKRAQGELMDDGNFRAFREVWAE